MRTRIVTWIERSLLVIVLFVLGAIFFPTPRPTSAEIRLDTGDLRYLRGDQIVEFREMREPYRSTLISASQGSKILTNRWHRCSNNPRNPERNTEKRCQHFFEESAVWLIADREIGLLVAEDVARYIETTDGQISQPDCYPLLIWVQKGPDGTPVVLNGWQKDEQVIQYLSQHGIRE